MPRSVAGVDEAGRGPLAGSVVAAAVILDPAHSTAGLDDSKKLTPRKREALFEEICEHALAYHIAEASVAEIDELNILWATMLAMKRAVEGLSFAPGLVQVDGNRCPQILLPCEAIVGGDGLVAAIGAASILAKVTRDRQMVELGRVYPQYDFAKHKGYPTKAHIAALQAHGICPQHRRSFGPVKRLLA